MALLQISEPGQSPDPHQRRIAIGIDLGTTNSLVASVRHGAAECLPDAAGRPLPRRPLTRRLIVGPERSREEIRGLIAGAKHSIRILDHKLSDPDLVALLRERRQDGVTVSVVGKQPIRGFEPHGKMMIIDESRAILGSTALSHQ